MKKEITYRTFDQLLDEVAIDFPTYNNEGFIEPAQLIKIAQKCNYDLGLKIHSAKDKILDVEGYKTKLPDDFYVFNYGHLCHKYSITSRVPSGRHTENVILDARNCTKCYRPDPDCTCEKTYTQECQNGEKIFVQVVEKRAFETRTYTEFEHIDICSTGSKCNSSHKNSGYIKNGFIYTSVDCGRLYINYQGLLEDGDGNLLVIDHPVINEYYEYAIKERLLENLYVAGEDVIQKLQYYQQKLRMARNNALSIVNTPDFCEMYQVWQMNRKAQYHKYYDSFKYHL